jgi:4-aminobutyrate aminotransferase-like enzyme/Ser/Thr protein kinase RdoA (MazF antagonist)
VKHLEKNKTTKKRLDVIHICKELYGLDVTVKQLAGEQDLNFRVKDSAGAVFVLKLSGQAEEMDLLKLQNEVLHFLAAGRTGSFPELHTPRIILSRRGRKIEKLNFQGQEYVARLLTYLPGKPIALVRPHSPRLMKELGEILGSIDLRLSEMDIPSAADRDFIWDIRKSPEVITSHLPDISDTGRRILVETLLETCLPIVDSRKKILPLGLIHNDANDYNVMVSSGGPGDLFISGLIDFGDMVNSWRVAEPAIAATYMMMGKNDPVGTACCLVSGYNSIYPLTDNELEVLFPLACLRACLSVCVSAYRRVSNPDNEYLTISEAPAWRLLEQVSEIHPRLAEYRLREACGKEPCSRNSVLISWFKKREGEFTSPVPVDLHDSSQVVLDLGVGSTVWNYSPLEFPGDKKLKDKSRISGSPEFFTEKLLKSGLTHLIGRYDEARLAYTGSRYQQKTDAVPERKNIHLGTDIFMPSGTPVYAPLKGVVYSCRDNARPLDYGPTVILHHQVESGPDFYTLYGHLQRLFLERIEEGMFIEQGLQIGVVGDIKENGGWPPHLHFQLISDILDRKKSFPGVSSPSQRKVWCSISPDPNLLLGIPGEIMRPGGIPAGSLLESRQKHLGKSLSVSYEAPLKIVRGAGQYLYDEEGRQYLDCVNNVCHVGHSHPSVVKAGMDQAFTLNTNTRYLHDNLVVYVENLLKHFPEPLDTCFLVCTGSEANELALRLAFTYTGANDVIAVDGAYHGNTQNLINISSYKHKGPGGKGAPDWAHIVSLPDGYRGPYKGLGEASGESYAGFVEAELADMASSGRKAAAFICESLPGCGGQIVLPNGYLKKVYSSVKKAGAVNIADEVQIGFGRVGSHFWGFETQGVIPDIVTLGKPIGNGHPLAAVVTTSEIADAFANGMEYFNTYGGNPVSCAIGNAVLEVMEKENLQGNAHEVGTCLLNRLGALKEKFELVGDVRGMGLYLGVELVLNRETLEPAPKHAAHVINRMRELGFLLSTDGPLHNVLKIKPPMVFSKANADQLVDNLEIVFEEIKSQV